MLQESFLPHYARLLKLLHVCDRKGDQISTLLKRALLINNLVVGSLKVPNVTVGRTTWTRNKACRIFCICNEQ